MCCVGSNEIKYSNVYATTGDLPNATTYHGMFAHVHGTGKGYFAHSGSWVELANASDIFDGDYTSLTNVPATFAPSAHTHAISEVTNLQTELNGKVDTTSVGIANGVAGLDADGKVPALQLPSYVDDIIEAADLTALNALTADEKVSGKIYVALDTNKTYRWSGSAFVEVSAALATADNLTTPRTISLSGDASGSVSFDGSADVDITVTVADDSHDHTIANVDGLQAELDLKASVGKAIAVALIFG